MEKVILIDRLGDTVAQLQRWQLSYADKGNQKAVEQIESMIKNVSDAMALIFLTHEYCQLEQAKALKWQSRYDKSLEEIEVLQSTIKQESYFIAQWATSQQ